MRVSGPGADRVRVEDPVANGRRVEDDDRRRRGGLGWLWPVGLLLLGLLALILIFGLRDDGGDESAGSAGGVAQQEGSGNANGSGGAAGGSASGGTLTAGNMSLLPVPAPNMLTGLVGQQVTGTSVPVQSVVSDEAFWVGTSEQDRMFVRLERGSESPFQVRAGEAVSFTGTMTQTDASVAEELGVTEDEGASQLASQGVYVDVPSGTLRQG